MSRWTTLEAWMWCRPGREVSVLEGTESIIYNISTEYNLPYEPRDVGLGKYVVAVHDPAVEVSAREIFQYEDNLVVKTIFNISKDPDGQ